MVHRKIFLFLLFILFNGILPNCKSNGNNTTQNDLSSLAVEETCNKIILIRDLPCKRSNPEYLKDPIYHEILNSGEAIIPCLIDKVTDIRLIEKPNHIAHAPYPPAVGDVAFFILSDFKGFEKIWSECFPKEYKIDTTEEYSHFVILKENRELLQQNLRVYYENYKNRQSKKK